MVAKEVTFVTQTKFYTPAFNSAIFDGPLRLYFSQAHEPEALRVYFDLQDRQNAKAISARKRMKANQECLFVMIYPTREAFEASFDHSENDLETARLQESHVIGVCGPLSDELHEQLIKRVLEHFERSPSTVIPIRPLEL